MYAVKDQTIKQQKIKDDDQVGYNRRRILISEALGVIPSGVVFDNEEDCLVSRILARRKTIQLVAAILRAYRNWNICIWTRNIATKLSISIGSEKYAR